MAGTLTPTPFQTVLDDTGVAVSGALIYTYTAGTTTAAATYTTSALSVANANPIVADSAGRYVAYLAAGANMKFVYKTAAGATIRTQDNVLSVPGAAVNLDIQGTVGVAVTAGQVCYLSSGAEATPLTPGLWYLTDADFAVSSTTCQSIGMAVSAIAINTAGTIRLAGLATTAAAVVVGSTYYVSATAGAITATAPAFSRVVGVADTTSTLILAATAAVATTLPNPISQDLLFVDATYDIGKSGASRPRDLFQSRNATVGNTLTVVGTSTLAAVGATTGTFSSTLGVTGVGTFTVAPVFTSATASQAMFTDAGKALVSNPVTGTGNVVMSASPTLTGTINAAGLTLTTPLDVASGGSGRATATTAYAVLAAGTTPTGAEQSIAPSTAGFVLTDNGTGVLPSFQATAAPPLGIAEGRLTLTSGTPVTTADVSAAATAYYTPYIGNSIVLFDGSSTWAKYTFTEITISLVGLTASRPYDVFAYNNSGTVTIETLVWTSATARATALAYQNGVLVKSGATTRRYLGTIYINSTGGQTDDTLAKRLVFNMYNRVTRALRRIDSTSTWSYDSSTVRQANGAAANKIEVMSGLADVSVDITVNSASAHSTNNSIAFWVGIGLDSTTTNATECVTSIAIIAQLYGKQQGASARLTMLPAVGYHYFAWLESTEAVSTATIAGNAGAFNQRSGISGMVML